MLQILVGLTMQASKLWYQSQFNLLKQTHQTVPIGLPFNMERAIKYKCIFQLKP
jgi:hypothetical protein